jgi:GcrA cell cycle regulator
MQESAKGGEMEFSAQTIEPVTTGSKPRYVAPRTQRNSFWADETGNVARLKELFAQGLSATEIFKQMGAVSRNAICSAIQRFKLSRDNGYESKTTRARVARDGHAKKGHKTKASHNPHGGINFRRGGPNDFVPITAGDDEYVERVPFDVPVEQRKTLLELGNETCRWPYGDPGDPDFYYCGGAGADLTENRPYCSAHMRLAAAPPRQRSRKPLDGKTK